MAVRLGSPGRPLGVLFVNHIRGVRFSRPELAFLETLTSYLSVTIERARLVSVLREAVTSLQAAVLPASFPTVPGLDAAALYRSASEVAQVGGDFYDVFAPYGAGRGRHRRRLWQGRGRGQAHRPAPPRAAHPGRGGPHPGPGPTALQLRGQPAEEFVEDEYATLLLCVLDPASGEVSWSSAGHPPPLLTGPTPLTPAFAGSLPVGCSPRLPHGRAGPLHPAAGRCLVLYTDGVVEAPATRAAGVRDRGAGGGRPAVAASAAAVAEVVLKQVLSHSGGHPTTAPSSSCGASPSRLARPGRPESARRRPTADSSLVDVAWRPCRWRR